MRPEPWIEIGPQMTAFDTPSSGRIVAGTMASYARFTDRLSCPFYVFCLAFLIGVSRLEWSGGEPLNGLA